MALGRALTRRLRRDTVTEQNVARSGTLKYTPGTINRNQISLPTELLSTTNVQALNAPDIRSISSSSSLKSSSDSEFSTIDRSFLANAGSDDSSIDSRGPETPITPASEGKDFFEKLNMPISSLEAPAIPQRAPSHSKKAHVELSRKRSMQRMSPPPTAIEQLKLRASTETSSLSVDQPFARELAKVSEVAEEFGVARDVVDQEEQEMINKGLCKFSVEDYIDEIAGIYGGVFEDKLGGIANPWV